MITLSEGQLKELLWRAFEEGEHWGRAYTGWFTPIEGQSREKYEAFLEVLLADIDIPKPS